MKKQEAIQLLEEMGEKENKFCPRCNSILIKKDGRHITKNKAKRQIFQCLECSKAFIIKDRFYHLKTSKKIINIILRIKKQSLGLSNQEIVQKVKKELNISMTKKPPITKRGVESIIKRFAKYKSQ